VFCFEKISCRQEKRKKEAKGIKKVQIGMTENREINDDRTKSEWKSNQMARESEKNGDNDG
jgi:hypothetical protein